MKERIKLGIAIFASCALMSACAPTHFVAPSVAPTRAGITRAQAHTTSAVEHSKKTGSAITSAKSHASTATTNIGKLEENISKNQGTQPENLKLAQDVHSELDALTQSLLEAGQENQAVQTDLANTQKDLADANQKLSDLDKKNQTLVSQANKAIADADRQKVKYHRLKAGACTIAAGLVGFVAFHFAKFFAFLGPWAWAVLLGAPALVWGVLWFVL